MPETEIRRAVVANRREGRRSLSAYGSHARGLRAVAGDHGVASQVQQGRPGHGEEDEAGVWSAGAALALVYALLKRIRPSARKHPGTEVGTPVTTGGEGAGRMTRKPMIKSLQNVSLEEATAYLEYFAGDELDAAYALAWDRNRLDGSHAAPDDAEVHHAAFLLCRTRGKCPPSFDEMRVQLRRRAAA